jgi:small GTP-binding protein
MHWDAKVVLIGNTNVGKTCIVTHAMTGSFLSETSSTLGAAYATKTYRVDSQMVRLQIWDTAGQEKYRGMTPMYYHKAQVALIVYSVADLDSFTAIEVWMKGIRDHADDNIILFIVGNKTDLSSERVVTSEMGAQKAATFRARFAEVSALTGNGIGDLFAEIPRVFLQQQTQALRSDRGIDLERNGANGGKPKCC